MPRSRAKITRNGTQQIIVTLDVDAVTTFDARAKALGIRRSDVMRHILHAAAGVNGDGSVRGYHPGAQSAHVEAAQEHEDAVARARKAAPKKKKARPGPKAKAEARHKAIAKAKKAKSKKKKPTPMVRKKKPIPPGIPKQGAKRKATPPRKKAAAKK